MAGRKPLQKSSVVVNHGTVHPMRFPNGSMSGCGARETSTREVSQVGEVADVVDEHGAAPAARLRPARDPGLEEEAVDDQLPTPVEQVEQAHPADRAFELVVLLDQDHRQPPALGG